MKFSGVCVKDRCEKRPTVLETLLGWLELIVGTVFAVVLVFTFVLRIVQVSGSSMQATLWSGDRLVLAELFYTPQEGDIVVLRSDVLEMNLIKRVIGTEGQEVVINYNAGTVTVDGAMLDEPYLFNAMADMHDYDESFRTAEGVYKYLVPEGFVFVLGDNRNASNDSRRIGFISENDVIGHVVFRISSVDAEAGFVK